MITQRLADCAAQARFGDLPDAAVVAAKRSILDAVGVMLAASGMGEGVAAFAHQARDLGGKPEATVLGFGFAAPALAAAFANGALAHALDFEDAYDGAPIHPNAATVPAALAVAQARGDVSGQELIAAVAVGCDLVCRLGLALTDNPDRYGFYPPPLLSAFGAAAAAGRLLRLDAAQMSDAFALTLSSSMASAQFKTSPASIIRGVRDAFSTQAGVQAAQLAARGVTGFDGAFEGKAGFYALFARGAYEPAVLLDGLGEDFKGAGVSFKLWPACRGTHAFIEAALELRGEGEVVGMTFSADPHMRMLFDPFAQKAAPRTAIDAKFSLPFTVATALVTGKVTLASFARLDDPAVLALAARSRFEDAPAPGMNAMTRGALHLELADGRRVSKTVEQPLGHPDNPLSDDQLTAKFRDCAGRALRPADAARAERFVEEALGLEGVAEASALVAGL